MALYLGFIRAFPGLIEDGGERFRAGEPLMDEGLVERALSLPGSLPDGSRILASYATMTLDTPNVMVVETDNAAVLQQINAHYGGYLLIEWQPALVVGGELAERESFFSASGAGAN